ncbi:hypothetical protein ZWY2020_020421 [Hordeum vulgare]|nr:hypothetical protein ZWY2020_020421 [Hordeum vulgare]
MAPARAAKRPKLEPFASASTSAAQHQHQRGDDDYVPGNIVVIPPSSAGPPASVCVRQEARDPDRASDADHPGGGGGRGSRWKGASWLRAILPRRGARRRDAKEGEEEEPSRPSGALDPHPHPGDVGGGGPSPPLVERGPASAAPASGWCAGSRPVAGVAPPPPWTRPATPGTAPWSAGPSPAPSRA